MTEIFNSMPPVYAPERPIASAPAMPTPGIQVKESIAANNVYGDTTQFTASKAEKRGPIKSLKRGIANIKKAFATIGEYTKGIFKSIKGAVIAGSVVFTAGSINNAIKTKAAHNALQAGQELPKKIKGTVPAKFLAGVAAAIAVAANLWTASLNAQDARSDIHDRYIGTNQR